MLGDRALPDGALDFLTNTLQLDPKNRLSAAASLNHPFLRPLRDADQKERKHRQLEEKRKQQRNAMDCDDGIEEEIPGEKHSSQPHSSLDAKADVKQSPVVTTPTYKSGPRTLDFKALNESAAAAGVAYRGNGQSNGHRVVGMRAAAKSSGNNSGECDSDDIQEIIEMDDHAHQSSPSKKTSSDTPPPTTMKKPMQRRKHSVSGKGVDPLEHECYEDDFEEYQS